jgi:hypothetical protein
MTLSIWTRKTMPKFGIVGFSRKKKYFSARTKVLLEQISPLLEQNIFDKIIS